MKQSMFVFSMFYIFWISNTDLHASCAAGNCSNGKGTYLFADGSKYTGTFLGGQPHGKGQYNLPDGSIYFGEMYNGSMHGIGKLTNRNGDVFIGDFIKNQINGKGRIKYSNGDMYFGTWRDGKPNGKGIYTFSGGHNYEGEMYEGNFQGQGKMTHTDGSYYEGTWAQNKKHGSGKEYSNGILKSVKYNMNVIDGGENMVTITTKSQSNSTTYLNCNDQYCHQVLGTLRYSDGSVYHGEFKYGKGEGKGTCMYASGDKYVGEWKNHFPHGTGTMTFAQGNTYTGVWNYGKPIKKTIIESTPTYHTQPVIANKKADGQTKIYALVIGVATYTHMPSLKYTDDDAYQLYAFLKSPEGGALPDDHIKIMIDEAVTYKSVLQELANLSAKADGDDVIMLYMSGHGLDGAYVPSDFDGYKNQIPYDKILQLLDQSSAKHKLFITDACHSGSMLASARSAYNVSLDNFYDAYSESSGGTAIITSSKKEEVSLEYGGLRQGVFSHFLIKGLKGYADYNKDKLINVSELYNYTSTHVKNYTLGMQHPSITGNYDSNMPVGMVR